MKESIVYNMFTIVNIKYIIITIGKGVEMFDKENGFTLAEVLITLGIIGVVAAMTLPALIQKNNNKVVEARLQKFYSAINQAVLMAENEYGDKKVWYKDLKNSDMDENGKPIEGSNEAEKWFRQYLAPYLKISSIKTLSDGAFMVYFPDGSALRPATDFTRDWYFYPGNPNRCQAKYGVGAGKAAGKCMFAFIFNPTAKIGGWEYHYNKGFEPYKVGWDGNLSKLYKGGTHSCGTGNGLYCSAIIQLNGWKIPEDYPFKVSY